MKEEEIEEIVDILYSWLYEQDDRSIRSLFSLESSNITNTVYRGTVLKLEDIYSGNILTLRGKVTSWTADYLVAEKFVKKHIEDVEKGYYHDELYDGEYNPLPYVGCILVKDTGLKRCLDMKTLVKKYEHLVEEIDEDTNLLSIVKDESEFLTDNSNLRVLRLKEILAESLVRVYVE